MRPQNNTQANPSETRQRRTVAETEQLVSQEVSISGWTGLATVFGIFSVIILFNLFNASCEAINYYSAYTTSKHDYVITNNHDRPDKEYQFILFGPSKVKTNIIESLTEKPTPFSHKEKTSPPANIESEKDIRRTDTKPPIENISFNADGKKIQYSSKLQHNDLTETDSNATNLIDSYRTLLKTQTTQQILKTATLLVSLILTTIATYFLVSRHFIEKNYPNADCDKQGLENLQRSLDRSILRYNTLGLVLFCFTLLIVLISGTLTFSMFASTIDNIKELESAKDNVAVILLYIMRTSLLTAFLTTTIIVFYRFSKSAIDQSVRFLKRKHATKFLKYLIVKTSETALSNISNGSIHSYFSKFINPAHYVNKFELSNLKRKLQSNNKLKEADISSDIINIDKLSKAISKIRSLHGLPELPAGGGLDKDDIMNCVSINNETLKEYVSPSNNNYDQDIPLQALFNIDDLTKYITNSITLLSLETNLNTQLSIDNLAKLMGAFEAWNADIGSAFGEGGHKKDSNANSINYILKEEKTK